MTTRLQRARLIGAAVAALAALAAPAAADSVLVAVGVSDGELLTENLVRTAAENEVLAQRWNVVAADVAAQRGVQLDRVPGCLDRGTECMKALVGPAGANRVLLLVVDRGEDSQGARWLLIGRLIDGQSGELVVSTQRTCESCSADKLAPFVEDVTRDLLSRDPSRADAVVGPESGADQPAAHRPYRIWKWVALGAGAGALVGGATLVAIHAEPVQDGAQQPTERDTKTTGFIVVGVGAALVATGVVLWIKDGRAARSASSQDVAPAAVTFAPADGGWLMSLSGRF